MGVFSPVCDLHFYFLIMAPFWRGGGFHSEDNSIDYCYMLIFNLSKYSLYTPRSLTFLHVFCSRYLEFCFYIGDYVSYFVCMCILYEVEWRYTFFPTYLSNCHALWFLKSLFSLMNSISIFYKYLLYLVIKNFCWIFISLLAKMFFLFYCLLIFLLVEFVFFHGNLIIRLDVGKDSWESLGLQGYKTS